MTTFFWDMEQMDIMQCEWQPDPYALKQHTVCIRDCTANSQ